MKKGVILFAVVMISLVAMTFMACQGQREPTKTQELVKTPEPEIVNFPDGNLETVIRDALGKPAGEEITVAELATLTTLSANLSNISDLSGLEYCINLTGIGLSENQIGDITPLSNLTSLTILRLVENYLDLMEGSEDMENIRVLQDRGVSVAY
jgi:hypothetical protein